MEKELVSVIMPSFNTGAILAESIDSILSQTYRNLELLITDDHSDDPATLDILRHYAAKDERVRVTYLPKNLGAGYARNTSIKAARGRYIAFCDSDDRWTPDKLAKQVAFIEQKQCCLVYSSYIICRQDGTPAGIVKAPKRVSFGMMKRDNKIGCLTALYDTTLCGKFLFPLLRKRQDWAMLLLLLKKCRYAYGLAEPMAYYRFRSESISHNKVSLIKYNINVYHKILGFSWAKSCAYFFLIFLPTYFVKTLKVRIDSCKYVKSNAPSGHDPSKRRRPTCA